MFLKRLLAATLIGVPMLFAPAFGGSIHPNNDPGSSGLTGWNIPGPCQTVLDNGGVPACSGVGQTSSFAGGSPANSARLFFPADAGGLFGSTTFPGWGYNGSQGDDPGSSGTDGSYFLPSGGSLDLGQPEDPAESAPEPSTLWLLGAGLAGAGLFGRKLALKPAASRERSAVR
ncbi:MAG: PEP-CTERM sorting domain-containing protein [Bryobacteraceae bacterium]